MQALEQYIQLYFEIQPNKLAQVAALFHEETLAKDEFFTKQGKYCKKLSFLTDGFLRVFAHTETKEITQWICSPDYFVADLSSLLFDQPAKWDIQALTDCRMYTISSENYQRIGRIVPEWVELEKRFIAKCFSTLEDRVFSFLSMTAEARYQALFQMSPDLFNYVPLHYLASMLGMTPETLSRIRKKRTS